MDIKRSRPRFHETGIILAASLSTTLSEGQGRRKCLAVITWERALFGSNGCCPLQIKLIFSKPASIYIYTDITYYSQTSFIKPNSTDLVNSNATVSVSTDPDGMFHWKLLKLLKAISVIICFVFIAFIFSTVFFRGKDNPGIISHWQDTFSRFLRVREHWRIKHTLLRERWINNNNNNNLLRYFHIYTWHYLSNNYE